MKLLEAIAAKAIEVREAQQLYFSLRKGNGRYPSTEARQVLKESKIREAELDELLTQYKNEQD